MSDSFNELWASSNPVKSQQPQPRTVGVTGNAASNIPFRSSSDAFSILASAGSSRPNSRPITPSNKHAPVVSKNTTTTGDAFGGLVSFGSSTLHDSTLTIAERAAKAERERKERINKNEATFDMQEAFLDKYEGTSSGKTSMPNVQAKSDGLWDLDFLTSTSKQLQTKSTASTNTNGAEDLEFVAPRLAVTVTTPTPVSTTDIFDIDHLDGVGVVQRSLLTESTRSNTPGNFNFGDREDPLLQATESQDENEGDILGSLVKPVKAVKSASSELTMVPSLARTSSVLPPPPPHVVGRIVEMGFSVQQARGALAATSTGLDVDAALEILLHHDGSLSPEDKGEEAMQPVEGERKSRRRQDSSRPTAPLPHVSSSSSHSELPLTNQQGLQEQADKLLAQASTFGMTMFSKANTFWKESREKVVKTYEEQRSGNLGLEAGKERSRPRWMDDVKVGEDGSEVLANRHQVQSHKSRITSQSTHSTLSHQLSEPSVSLSINDEPVYRSPAQRRPPATTLTSKALSSSSCITPSAPSLIIRPIIHVSASSLAASSTHKSVGTDHFKLGRFAEAEAAYSRAIDALPTSHLLRIPLYNNRALTRLKIGEYKGAVHDTSEVVRIVTGDVGTAWHPRSEEVGKGEDLGHALGKALRRRAEAYEGLEKWKAAVDDWEQLRAAAWVNPALRVDATKGAIRCRQMAGGDSSLTTSQVALSRKPPLKSKPVEEYPACPSEALARVRAATMVQEMEDQARHDLKDVVDARLAAWRTGRENNLRALIASLDVVLPPTFGWHTVSMSDLISPGQVKIQYTKAIAKLHPDKLNMNNTTLEERMIANSVFGTLSEVWNTTR